jgi:hypothetical protein
VVHVSAAPAHPLGPEPFCTLHPYEPPLVAFASFPIVTLLFTATTTAEPAQAQRTLPGGRRVFIDARVPATSRPRVGARPVRGNSVLLIRPLKGVFRKPFWYSCL